MPNPHPDRTRRDRLAAALGAGGVLLIALVVTVPTVGDFGLTWDEPTYRGCEAATRAWWARAFQAAVGEAAWSEVLSPEALRTGWPYAEWGTTVHPPLAFQASLLTDALFSARAGDLEARRLAPVIELALTATILFVFLRRAAGPWAGLLAAGALISHPRLYAHSHISGNDTAAVLLWTATAWVFWNGWTNARSGAWKVAFGILLGLGALTKTTYLLIVAPLFLWILLCRFPYLFQWRDIAMRRAWLDALVTLPLMIAPLLAVFVEIRRLAALPNALEPPPDGLFRPEIEARVSPLLLAMPLAVWLVRRLIGWLSPGNPLWGAERPGLAFIRAAIAWAPVVFWLGNPGWWRRTLPTMAHFHALNVGRRDAMPDLPVLFFGQLYEYAAPWPNAWILIAITTPPVLLLAAAWGIGLALRGSSGRLSRYALLLFVTPLAVQILPVPAHDGLRLLLPCLPGLAILAGLGGLDVARRLAARWPGSEAAWGLVVTALMIGPAALALSRIHPFELSYYNRFIGGPEGAWKAGFDQTYWYDAFDPVAIAELNDRLPEDAGVAFCDDVSIAPVFADWQRLGRLRDDLRILPPWPRELTYQWLQTRDSKATPYSRLLFVMEPWYARRPAQVDGLRLATVADPVAVSRAWALWLLTDASTRPEPTSADPEGLLSWTGRLWGAGLEAWPTPGLHEETMTWAATDPEGLRSAARALMRFGPAVAQTDEEAARLLAILRRHDPSGLRVATLMDGRPAALGEAVAILIRRPEDVRAVLTRFGFTDPEAIGGYLDLGLPTGSVSPPAAASRPSRSP